MGNEPGQQPNEPDKDAIRTRAHQIWVEEGKPDGRALDHWVRARWELEQESGSETMLEKLERNFEPRGKKD